MARGVILYYIFLFWLIHCSSGNFSPPQTNLSHYEKMYNEPVSNFVGWYDKPITIVYYSLNHL